MHEQIAPYIFQIAGIEFVLPHYVIQLLLALFFGLIIGVEREFRGKPASLRTFTVISAGACLLTMLSVRGIGVSSDHDTTRIAAQIVTGIGFIGGGVIFKTTDRVEGVTTGALIFFVAAVGMACGFNALAEATWAFVLLGISHFCIMFLYPLIYVFKRAKARASGAIVVPADD